MFDYLLLYNWFIHSDFLRHKSDRDVNETLVRVLRNGQFDMIKRKDIYVRIQFASLYVCCFDQLILKLNGFFNIIVFSVGILSRCGRTTHFRATCCFSIRLTRTAFVTLRQRISTASRI